MGGSGEDEYRFSAVDKTFVCIFYKECWNVVRLLWHILSFRIEYPYFTELNKNLEFQFVYASEHYFNHLRCKQLNLSLGGNSNTADRIEKYEGILNFMFPARQKYG